MSDNNQEHLEVHLQAAKVIAQMDFEVKWSSNWFVHHWKRFWRGPKMVSGKEYFKYTYKTFEKHILDHKKLVKK